MGQLVLEPDHDDTTEVNASSAATVAAMTAMSIAVMAMMIIVISQIGQFNWPHGLACPSENEVLVADLNNWRVQKLVTKGAASTDSR